MKILLVEDKLEILELFGELLIYEGHAVLKAENGKKALEVLAEHDVDLIFLDLMMPVMSGVDLLKNNIVIKEKLFPHDFNIVIMTATPESAPPGYPILHKPFNFDDALRCINGR